MNSRSGFSDSSGSSECSAAPRMPIVLSVIIPAYNEELYIGATLAAVKSALADNPGLSAEIIVVDNNSSDSTAETARAMGARVVFESENGIARARNAGAKAASGNFLIFIDADTRPAPGHIRNAVEMLSSGQVCGGGALVRFDGKIPLWASALTAVWNFQAGILGMAAGCFIFCRKDLFFEAGGFNADLYASEELWLCRALKKAGARGGMKFRIIKSPPVLTSSRKFEWHTTREILWHCMALLIMFPVAVRSRRLCRLWYERPGKQTEDSGRPD